MTDEPISDGGSPARERRVRLPDSAELKRQLVEKVGQTLRDEEIETISADGPVITLPPIVIDADPTDDIEITIDPVIIDSDPTD